jgi:catechol 2,3-dioxygenase-like lactoylglutathione lyase family enzyme
MKIEHANYVVKDVDASVNFLQAAFPNARIRGKGTYQWYGQERTWLHFGTDKFYITLNSGGDEDIRDFKGAQVGLTHIGFEVEDLMAVIERLRAAGFEKNHFGDGEGHRKNAYYFDPNGLEYEFVQYFSDQADERNQYN